MSFTFTAMKRLLILVLIHLTFLANAQEDYLLELRQKSRSSVDSVRFAALRDLGYEYEWTDTSAAMAYYREALSLAQAKGNQEWMAKAYTDFGNVASNVGQLARAEELHRLSLYHAQQAGSKSRIAVAYANLSANFAQRNFLDSAVALALMTIPIFEEMNDQERLLITLSNVAGYFNDLHNYSEGIDYALRARELAMQIGNVDEYVISGMMAARAYMNMGDLNRFKLIMDESMPRTKEMQDPNLKCRAFQNAGSFYMTLQDYTTAGPLIDSSLVLSAGLESIHSRTAALVAKAHWLIMQGRKSEGVNYLNEALPLARESRQWTMLREIYLNKADLAEEEGDFKNAYTYLEFVAAYKDSIYDEEVAESITTMRERFEAERNQRKIEELASATALSEAARQQQRIWLILLTVLVLGSLITLILVYRNSVTKRTISRQELMLREQRIQELEKERQLIAMDGLLKGEEQERTRLAKDLHDGLGSILTGVKLSLSSMKGNMIIQQAHAQVFQSALMRLDEAIGEMRRVAHNMMPESLVTFGLEKALRQLCESMSDTGVDVIFEAIGMQGRLPKDKEVNAYRIVQELLNNALKHAEASQVIVQISQHNDRVDVIVEDNGKGMAGIEEGAGWANIRNRIDYIRGTLDKQTQHGQGTSIHLSFPTL